jgi:serine/threonine protein kinase
MDLSDAALRHLRGALERPETIGERYEIAEELGRGGMGTVFRAHDRALGRDVAVKVLAQAELDPRATERLRREARIAAALEHPGIVPVYDVGALDDGRPYYVMKLVSGARLDQWIASDATRDARLDLFLRICDAVAYAHAHGVVHRDLKPENVRIGPFGDVQVLDFGVAKVLAAPAEPDGAPATPRERAKTASGAVVGTPGWMAPEQERGEADVDARADVFALGRLLGVVVGAGADRVPRSLAAIVAKACAPAREARYARADELAADVRRFRAGEAVVALPEGPLARAWRLAGRHRTAIVLVLAYVALRLLFAWVGKS